MISVVSSTNLSTGPGLTVRDTVAVLTTSDESSLVADNVTVYVPDFVYSWVTGPPPIVVGRRAKIPLERISVFRQVSKLEGEGCLAVGSTGY